MGRISWLIAHTITLPKGQRFVVAKHVEEAARSFQERPIRVVRADDQTKAWEVREADILFGIPRRRMRARVGLKLPALRQCECGA